MLDYAILVEFSQERNFSTINRYANNKNKKKRIIAEDVIIWKCGLEMWRVTELKVRMNNEKTVHFNNFVSLDGCPLLFFIANLRTAKLNIPISEF